jgi:cysteine synthase B
MTDSRDYPTLADTVGNTPLVRLPRMPGTTTNVILGKLEGNNPAGSVKDRPALSMIVEAERRGDIHPGDTLIEATSGNTGIALAMVAAIKGYKLILVMPDNQSLERVQTMRAYGAQLVQVTKAAGMEAHATWPIACRPKARDTSSTSSPIRTTRSRTTEPPGRKSGATRVGASRTSFRLWELQERSWACRNI